MKRVAIVSVVLLAAVALSGCSIVVTPTGFSTPSPAFVYTNMTFPSILQDPKMSKEDYKILGEVHGTSMSRNILNIAATGDNGIEKAYKDALQKVGGDAIINARVDTEASSILFLYSTVKTHVYGTAVKYTK